MILRAIVFCAQLVSLLAFGLPWKSSRGFPLDDAWIHQVVARSFATTGTLGYRPGVHGSAATSQLWAALLAVGHAVHADPVVFTNAIAVSCALVSGQLLLALLRAPAASPPDLESSFDAPAVAATVLACAGGDFAWFAFSGMEVALAVALTLGAILACTRAPQSSHHYHWTAGALAGGVALARPDFIPLGALLATLTLHRTRRIRPTLALAIPWAAACLLYFVANAALAGALVPATMQGRRWLWIDSVVVEPSFGEPAVGFVWMWAERLCRFTLGSAQNAFFWIALGLAGFGVHESIRTRRVGLIVTCAWVLLHFLVFVVVLPVPGHGGRYQPLVPLVFVVLVVLGTMTLARHLVPPRWRRASLAATAAVATTCFALAWGGWRAAHQAAVEHIHETEEQAGLALRELAPDARIASFDIGAISYFSGRAIFDLGGLSDARVGAALRDDRLVELLREERIDHVVLPAGEKADFPDHFSFARRLGLWHHPELELPLEQTFSAVDGASWLRGFTYTANAAYRQDLRRVVWTSCQEPRPFGPNVRASDWRLDVDAAEASSHDSASETIRRARAALSAAAARGLCVRAWTSPPERRGEPGLRGPAPVDACWSLDVLAADPLVAFPSDADASHAREQLAIWMAPYIRAGDAFGAAMAGVYALADETRLRVPCFWTPLPALEAAVPAGRLPPKTPATTAIWGLPLAMLIAASATRSVSRRRLRSRESSDTS